MGKVKLIRERVPALIRAAGDQPIVRTAESNSEYRSLLRATLVDLTGEYLATEDRRKLADMAAIITAIAKLEKINLERIIQRRDSEYGSYMARTVLEGYEGGAAGDPLTWLRGVSE